MKRTLTTIQIKNKKAKIIAIKSKEAKIQRIKKINKSIRIGA